MLREGRKGAKGILCGHYCIVVHKWPSLGEHRLCWKPNWLEKQETHTEVEQDFKLLLLWTHSLTHVAKSICCFRSEPSTPLHYVPHKAKCAKPGWSAPTCTLPTPEGDEERMDETHSGVLLPGCILFIEVWETETLPALPSQFNHLLLPRCTAGPACDWLGPQPASIQFVA